MIAALACGCQVSDGVASTCTVHAEIPELQVYEMHCPQCGEAEEVVRAVGDPLEFIPCPNGCEVCYGVPRFLRMGSDRKVEA